MVIHVLSDRDLTDPSNDGFTQRLGAMFGRFVLLNSWDSREAYVVRDSCSKKPGLGIRFIDEIQVIKSTNNPYFLKIEKIDNIPEDLKSRILLVLVNKQRTSLEEVASEYPEPMIAFYADSDQESSELTGKNGDVMIFRPQLNKQSGVMRFVYGNVKFMPEELDFSKEFADKRVLLKKDINGLLAEYKRRGILSREDGGCFQCKRARIYYFIQQYFINRDDLEGLFEFSPISGKVDVSQYPIMGKPGPICTRWDTYTQGGWGVPKCKDYGIETTRKVLKDFTEKYRELVGRV